MTFRPLVAGVLLAGAALTAQSHDFKIGEIAIGHPYARSTAPGQPSGGAYLRLANHGTQPDRLLGARTDMAKAVEVHRMQMQGDVMRMRQVEAVDLPPHADVVLEPGGLHLMLLGLKGPLKEGERFPMTLKFEKAGEVKVEVAVESPKAGPGKGEAKHDMKH